MTFLLTNVMDSTKKTSITSSMVELKAELFRKQEEFKRQKATGSSFVRGAKPEKSKKLGIWSQQNAGVLARAKKDETSRTSDEEDVHTQSRKALEAKAKLYDRLCNSSTVPDEDGSELYLVDFQKKVIDSIVEDHEAQRKKEVEEEEAERAALAAIVPESVEPDEEWIDFKDSLGRDRRCMKKDLDHLMKQDRDLALAASKKTKESGDGQLPSLMSVDMHREMMRQKWENEMKELQEKDQQDIHYSNVRFDEIRSHGVGFFQFSKDHETREEQLENLKKMREETLDEHSRKEVIKEKRKAMMEARLAKVRQRRNLKEPPLEVKSESEVDSETIGPKLSEATLTSTSDDAIKKEEIEKAAEEKRKAHVREWDRGKHVGKKSYVEVLRDEREPEFAPPSLYFDEPKNRQKQNSDSHRMKRLHASLTTTSEDFSSVTDSGSENVVSSDRSDDIEDKTQVERKVKECVKECNTSEPERAETEKLLLKSEDSPAPYQHSQTPGHTGVVNSWIGYYSGNEIPGNQTESAGQYAQNQMLCENINSQPPTGYQYCYMPWQQQQGQQPPQQEQDHYQWQSAQYISNNVSHQQYNNAFTTGNNQQYNNAFTTGNNQQCSNVFVTDNHPQYSNVFVADNHQQYSNLYGAGNQQGGFMNATPLPGTLPIQNTGMPAATHSDSEPRKAKIPKMAILDTRYVKNEETPIVPDMLSTSPPIVTAVPYVPGSFTAAMEATSKMYEEAVAESGLKTQISGSPLLYTKDQLMKQALLQPKSPDDN